MRESKVKNLRARTMAFLIAVILPACNGTYTSWERDKQVHGIAFQKIRYAVVKGDTLSIIGYLQADTQIQGYLCGADWIHFTKSWGLKLFRLNQETVINGFNYPPNTWIQFTDDGGLVCVFPEATRVQGYLCKGGGGAQGVQTAFYHGGRLRYFFSPQDALVGGIKCKGGIFHIIGLYEDGNLKECTLAEETVIQGIRYRKNKKLFFHPDGRVRSHSDKEI